MDLCYNSHIRGTLASTGNRDDYDSRVKSFIADQWDPLVRPSRHGQSAVHFHPILCWEWFFVLII